MLGKDEVIADAPVGAIYVTGATGFLGRCLVDYWSAYDGSVPIIIQTRNIAAAKKIFNGVSNIRFVSCFADLNSSEAIDLVVNLAGAPIADKPWSVSRKQLLMDSRVSLSKQLFEDIANAGIKVKTLIQASAVGIYGYEQPAGDITCEESDPVGSGFAAELCTEWEQTCMNLTKDIFGRIVVLRLAVILGKGGLLNKMLPVFKLGLGGPIGSGRQPFPWVHLDDVVGFIDFAVKNIQLEGSFNIVAPQYCVQGEFASTLANALNRPSFCRVPAWFLRSIMGQLAEELLLGGRYVSCSKLEHSGYQFKFTELKSALSQIV